MSQTEDLQRFLSLLVYYVGGKENIISYTNCMTRLRIELDDVDLIKMKDIDTTGSPHRLALKEHQLQVMLGPGLVGLATELLAKELGDTEKEGESVHD